MKKFLTMIFLLFCQLSYSQEMAFLRGCWQNNVDGKLIEECWSSSEASTILGTAKTSQRGKLVSYEFLKISKIANEFSLTPYPDGKEGPLFKVNSLSSSSVTFTNPQNLFPRTISYSVFDEIMSVSLEGIESGRPVHIEYKLRKKY